MIYTLSGELVKRNENNFVLENAGIGFQVLSNQQTLGDLPAYGEKVRVFCFLYIRETRVELYGFLTEESLKFFELLNTVSGIGPKTALGILDAGPVANLMASVAEKKTEFLTRSSGIGQKTADRIVLELQNKIKLPKTFKGLTDAMAVDDEIESALIGLGYSRNEARQMLKKAPPASGDKVDFAERLKQVLKKPANHE